MTDASGAAVTQVSATGNGAAEFSKFKADFGLAAKRASAEVSEKLSQEIRRNDKLR